MQIKPVRNEEDHKAALGEIEGLWGSGEDTPEGDRLEVLVALVEAYERAHFHFDAPNPIEAIKFRLEQQGEDAKSLVGIIGSRTRVYEVLRGDRPLTLQMIRRLHEHLQIPAELLIRPSRVRGRKAAA
jgi:HTH-type transcriptional regulator/antitoxin HigA